MIEIDKDKSQNYNDLLDKIQSLEKRLSGIESILKVEWVDRAGEKKLEIAEENEHEDANTESKIVEYGLAWLGSIVLLFGIIFLLIYLDSLGLQITSRVAAYASTFAVITFIYFQQKTFPILVNVLTICAPLLLFCITLSLHFFSTNPIIAQPGLELILLLILVVIQFGFALRKNSEFLASIAFLMAAITAIFIDSTYITFSILTAIASCALIVFFKKLWSRLLIFSLFIVYLSHLIWLFNNPFIGNQMRIVATPQNSIFFLYIYGILYALTILISNKKQESNGVLISTAIWNALFFSLLLFITSLSFYSENYSWIFGIIALFCILFAVLLKLKVNRNFAPATYACFGFMAFSVSVYGFSGLPDAYFLLVLESLGVVSMALWFRSQIIVIANSFLFVSILLIYLTTSTSVDSINFAFAITAFATARILNWKKERLTLKTEMFRNVYLLIVFFMVLYSLSHALPSQYVTLAWTAAAIVFFILSILLKRIKYRWMSILTIVVTGGHLFFIDLAQMEIGYRVIAFLVFAVISLGVSLYYTKRIHKSTK